MKLPDVNIWFTLSVQGHSHHDAALRWLKGEATFGSVYFCRPTLQGYLRLITTESTMNGYSLDPASNQKAWERYETFLSDPHITFASEPPGLEET